MKRNEVPFKIWNQGEFPGQTPLDVLDHALSAIKCARDKHREDFDVMLNTAEWRIIQAIKALEKMPDEPMVVVE